MIGPKWTIFAFWERIFFQMISSTGKYKILFQLQENVNKDLLWDFYTYSWIF